MNAEQVLFLVVSAIIVASAIMVVCTRRLMHAALWLVAALFGVAVLYALLQAAFLVVIQIVVYIGAIAVLFIFAIMLTRRDLRDQGPQARQGRILAVIISLCTLGGLALLVTAFPSSPPPAMRTDLDPVTALGLSLLSPEQYALPFEVASVLLLAALVGAVHVATSKRGRRNS